MTSGTAGPPTVGLQAYRDRVAGELSRADVVASRVRAHQLDRSTGTLADTAMTPVRPVP